MYVQHNCYHSSTMTHNLTWLYLQGSCRVVKRFVDSSDQMRNGRKHKSLPGGKNLRFHFSLDLSSYASTGPLCMNFMSLMNTQN